MKTTCELTNREKYPNEIISNYNGNIVINERLRYECLFLESCGIFLDCG